MSMSIPLSKLISQLQSLQKAAVEAGTPDPLVDILDDSGAEGTVYATTLTKTHPVYADVVLEDGKEFAEASGPVRVRLYTGPEED